VADRRGILARAARAPGHGRGLRGPFRPAFRGAARSQPSGLRRRGVRPVVPDPDWSRGVSDNPSPRTPPTTPLGSAPSYKIVDHTYDVIVVGAGGSGLRATMGSAESGLKTA